MSAGPSFLVAKEWRGRGIGGRLFKAIEQHYTAVFEGWYNVRLLICEVTSGAGPGRHWHLARHVMQPILYPRSLHEVPGVVSELRC